MTASRREGEREGAEIKESGRILHAHAAAGAEQSDDVIMSCFEIREEGRLMELIQRYLETPLTLQHVAGMLSWSSDGHYFFTRNDNMPTALWIWDICRLELAAVLVQKDPIRAAAWDPTCPRLVLCTESPHLYVWTPSGACCVNIPLPNFRIVDLKWNSDGGCLLLKDRESFCCAAIVSVVPEEEPDESDDSSEDE